MEKVSISEILSLYRPVVPEIQRDYVWGKNQEVLAQFIGDLDKKLGKDSHKKANIGFLYSYPRGNENYVIDGQQRLTTILLLLHYLSVKDPAHHEHFKRMILPDDSMPAFAYRVRPTSLSFMKMLFKCTAADGKTIQNLKDYKLCYNNDVTVRSCLATLDWFSANLSKYPNLSYSAILENVEFWYFSVKQTSQGEELYISMNSRGERLTESEHIKPRLFDKLGKISDKLRFGKKWDEWEEFFYRHKNDRHINSVDTAMNNIIRIVVELNTGSMIERGLMPNHAENITLDEIATYMSALCKIHEIADDVRCPFIRDEIYRLYGDDKDKPRFADGDFNVLKTLLTEYIRPTEASFHSLEQVYHLMRNLLVRGILKSSKDLLALLSDMKRSDKSFYDYIIDCSEYDRWHSVIADEQEVRKIKIFKLNGVASERQIWDAQETSLWKGDIKPLLDWATVDGNYSVKKFDRMRGLLKEFFKENNKEGLVSDETRRVLLTFNMVAYPWWKRDSQAYFGHTADEWRQIILINSDNFRNFLNKYAESKKSPSEFCGFRIDKEYAADKDWSEFVKYPYLLKYLDTKHVTYTNNRGIFLEQGCYAKQISVNDEHLYHILNRDGLEMLSMHNCRVRKDHSGNDNWVLVTDDIVRIGMWYEQNYEMRNGKKQPIDQCYIVRLVKRNCETSEEGKSALQQVADEFEFVQPNGNTPLKFVWDENNNYYMLKVSFPNRNDFNGAAQTILKLLEQLLNTQASLNGWK